jgi:hypothetical protein
MECVETLGSITVCTTADTYKNSRDESQAKKGSARSLRPQNGLNTTSRPLESPVEVIMLRMEIFSRCLEAREIQLIY